MKAPTRYPRLRHLLAALWAFASRYPYLALYCLVLAAVAILMATGQLQP